MSFYTQYHKVRAESLAFTENNKVIAIMRVGDFFEAFDDDAKTLSRICDIVLCHVKIGKHGRHPIASFLASGIDRYIAMLNKAGYTAIVVHAKRILTDECQ